MSKVRNIVLSGRLGARFGRVHRLAVESTAEAIRALCITVEGFQAYLLTSRDAGLSYAVFVDKRNIGREELCMHSKGDIRFAPVLTGSKNLLGTLQVIAGIALVAVGFMVPGAQWAISLGIGLIIGGASMMLAVTPKDPKAKDKGEDEASYAFNGPVNTQAQGNPVPLLYGEMVTGSAVASAGISSSDSVYIPYMDPTPPVGTGDGGGLGSTDSGDETHWEAIYDVGSPL